MIKIRSIGPVIIVAILFAFASATYGAIAFDAASEGNTGTAKPSSLTVSHAVGSGGTNTILVVGINIESTLEPMATVTAVTYAGQDMTFLAAVNGPSDTKVRSEMWYITAPATGTNDIVITFSDTLRAVAGGMSFTGVDQTNPFGSPATYATANGSDDSPTVAVSSAAGELVVDTVTIRQNDTANVTLTKGANQTERYNDVSNDPSPTSNAVGAGSEEAGAASVTMSWSASDSRDWAIVAASLEPASATSSLTPLIAYSQNGSTVNNQLYYSKYVSADWSAGALVGTDPNGDWDQHHKVARVSPDSSKIAVVWKNYDQAYSQDDLMASIWDGASWSDGAGGGPIRDFGRYPYQFLGRRTFDAAFMQESGRFLVASSINNQELLC